MNDLVAFLRARLDEDEQYARAAVQTSERWVPYSAALAEDGETSGVQDRDGNPVAISYGRPFPSGAQVQHIVRHDPARVLQEVAAKRQLVERLETVLRTANGQPTGDGLPTASDAARLLALPYARHPDYQIDWAPSPA